jgi:alkyl hydroperoxide reductase subunit AhpC
VLGLSVDADVDNQSWIKEIEKVNKCVVDFPIINDKDYEIACLLGMINPDHCDDKGMPLTARSVFVIDKDHKVRATITYPASTGRNFAEIVRLVDSIRMTDGHKVATPADWKVGDKCIVLPNISTEDAKKMFSNVDEVLPYLRYTKIE